MGKTARCIKIIQILSCRDLVNTNELADILEINPRNIKEYIKELELCGYKIYSVTGKNGGYKLDKSETIPSLHLTVDDKKEIMMGIDFMRSSNYPNYLNFEDVMSRITSSISLTNITPINVYDRFPLNADKKELQKTYNILVEAENEQLKCKIAYVNSANYKKEHMIHPYKTYFYNGAWFVLAYNETINEFGYFKLNRIEEILITRNHFTRMKTYNENDFLDSFGMRQNGEYYSVELEFKDLYQAISERTYGKNQRVEIVDNHTTILKCQMQNKDIIKSFVLGFGSKCRVLYPEWLKEAVKEEINSIKGIYEE